MFLAAVALPLAVGGPGLEKRTTDVLINCSLVVVILAVTPWEYTWRSIVKAAGDPWR